MFILILIYFFYNFNLIKLKHKIQLTIPQDKTLHLGVVWLIWDFISHRQLHFIGIKFPHSIS